MRSKWVIVAFLAIALLSPGACRGLQEGSEGSAADASLGSETPVGSTSPAAQITPANVAGSWSLILTDAATGRAQSVEVNINQIDEVIFGRGSTGGTGTAASFLSAETEPRPTRDEGIRSMVWWLHQDPTPVAQTTASSRYLTVGASGLVSGQRVSLDLIFLDQNVLYKLNLNLFGNSVSGTYLAYDSGGWVRSGSCYGSIRAGLGQAAVPLGSSPQVSNLGGTGP